jgi:Tfp pilus assembly protein PilN
MVRVNLISDTSQLAQIRRRRIRAWAVSTLSAASLLAIPLTIDRLQRTEAAELDVENGLVRAELARMRVGLAALKAQVDEAGAQLERAAALRTKRSWSALFAMIDTCMPQGCWLVSVATDPAAPLAGGGRKTKVQVQGSSAEEKVAVVVIEAPRELRIAGYAVDPSEPLTFVSNLKETAVFTDVTLENLRTEPVLDGHYFRFELSCEW